MLPHGEFHSGLSRMAECGMAIVCRPQLEVFWQDNLVLLRDQIEGLVSKRKLLLLIRRVGFSQSLLNVFIRILFRLNFGIGKRKFRWEIKILLLACE